MTMKRCPQCDTELNQDGDLTNCHQCGFDLIVPKTIVVDDMVNDSKISDSRPTTTVSEVIVVEEFSIEQDLLNIDSTQESDDLETDLLKDKTAISKQLSIDAATQQSELSDRPVPAPTISAGLQSARSINVEVPDREISSEAKPSVGGKASETDYELIREVGRGAAGIVFSAKQKSLDRDVAIKMLAKQTETKKAIASYGVGGDKDVEKFLYESQITARLDHPNIIIVHDMGVTSDDKLFYSMKLLDGKDWFTTISTNSLQQNLEIFDRVCDAIRYSHKLRIIHRDLKPQNVLVGQFGEVQVTDWGLAIDLNEIRPKAIVGGGTPCFMAPEMSRHFLAQTDLRKIKTRIRKTDDNEKLDELHDKLQHLELEEELWSKQIQESSDIYVLGAILFQIATGYPPHLFQLTDELRDEWGTRSGKNKIRNELFMSAKGTIASYKSKFENDAARTALREIATTAMATKQSDRYAGVGDLQTAVYGLRNLTLSITASDRGQQELSRAKEDASYQSLANASHSFNESLELWSENEDAIIGRSETTMQYAGRALEKKDFELGLSLLSDEIIETVTDQKSAKQLQQALVTGKRRRERRTLMFWLATLAAGALIAFAIPVSLFAIAQYARASRATEDAAEAITQKELAVTEAQKAVTEKSKAEKAKDEAEEAKKEADRLAKIATEACDTALERKTAAEEETAKAIVAKTSAQNMATEASKAEAIAKRKAEKQRIISKYRQYTIANQQEEFEFSAYLSSTSGVVGAIENLDVQSANQGLESIFQSTNIPLKLKNSWELHHLHKKANPIGKRSVGQNIQIRQVFATANGQQMLAVTTDNQIGTISGAGQNTPNEPEQSFFKKLNLADLELGNIRSLDLSRDGQWLVVARALNTDAPIKSRLPVLINVASAKSYTIDPNVTKQLVFESIGIDQDAGAIPEKFYFDCQYVKIVSMTSGELRLLMVDRRVERGINVFRCSLLPLQIRDGELALSESADVVKAKVAGQPFFSNPGLLSETDCIVDATVNGTSLLVAISANFPQFGVCVFDLAKAAEARDSVVEMRTYSKVLDGAPTSLLLTGAGTDEIKLLVGSGSGQISRYSCTSATGCALSLRKDFVFNGHRTPIRRLVATRDTTLVSASKTEIIQWDLETGDNLQQFFGHRGAIADLSVRDTGNGPELTSFANLKTKNSSEMRVWKTQTTEHEPMIERKFNRSIKTAAIDQMPGSNASAIAFDDGELRYKNGTNQFAIPNPSRNSLPDIDFRVSEFNLFEDRWLTIFSNEHGLLVWDIGNANQVTPSRPSAELFNDRRSSNGETHLAASNDGKLLVTSHPSQSDKLMVWRRENSDGIYSGSPTNSFTKSGRSASRLLKRSIEPFVSPDGKFIAVVVRLRNTFQLQVYETDAIGQANANAIYQSTTESNSKFRGLFFAEDSSHLVFIKEGSVQYSPRLSQSRSTKKLVKIVLGAGGEDQQLSIPSVINEEYGQFSVVDYSQNGGGQFLCVGSPRNSAAKDQVSKRDLIVFSQDKILDQRPIRFSRKLNAELADSTVKYLETGTDSQSRIVKYRINSEGNQDWKVADAQQWNWNLSRAADAVSVAKWQAAGNHAVVAGRDSIAVYSLADHTLARKFGLSTKNAAKSLQLASRSLLVHHPDNTISLIQLGETATSSTIRLAGRFRAATLTPDGSQLATINPLGSNMEIFDCQQLFAGNKKPIRVLKTNVGETISATWVSPQVVKKLAGTSVNANQLACVTRDKGKLTFQLLDPKTAKLLTSMQLETNDVRLESAKNIQLARNSGSILGILWDSNRLSNCDLWELATTEDGGTGMHWVHVNVSKALKSKRCTALTIGEPQLTANNDSATRVAIASETTATGGATENAVNVYLVQLADLTNKNAIDVENQRDLTAVTSVGQFEPVQKLTSVAFSSDGKTLLTANIRGVTEWQSSGWDIKKAAALSAKAGDIYFTPEEVEFLGQTIPSETEAINELPVSSR